MTQKTQIQRLKLTDFRNYAQAGLSLDGRHVVLVGDNGAGKTNFMEAISFLSPGRGLRRAVLSDIPRLGASGSFTVFAAIEGMALLTRDAKRYRTYYPKLELICP